jgi:hypothetical protein
MQTQLRFNENIRGHILARKMRMKFFYRHNSSHAFPALAMSVLGALAAFSPLEAQTNAAAQMRTQMANQMQNQMQHQMMMQMMPSSKVYSIETMEANMTSFFTVYSKDSVASGYGALQTEKASFLRGTKRRSLIEFDGQRFMPGFTDSVFMLDGYGKAIKGIPNGENWIFIAESGRITAYSDYPGGEIKYVTVADDKLLSLDDSKEKAVFEKELRTITLAAFFHPASGVQDPMTGRASSSTSSPLIGNAVKHYNLLHGKTVQLDQSTRIEPALFSLFSADSVSDFGMSSVKFRNPEDFVEMSVQAKYFCGKGNHAEAEPLIAKLESLIPGFYGTLHIKGLCAQTRGDVQEAWTFYHRAYQYAPPRSGILESYYRKIQRYEKILAK